MTDRDYDLVLYGATGFVGRQTLAYVAKHRDSGELRFAIAGRNRAKLESVRTQIGGAARKPTFSSWTAAISQLLM